MAPEFALGMAVGGALLAGRRLPERWAPLTAAAAILAMAASSLVPGLDESPCRALLYGTPAALLLASLVAMEDRWGRPLSGLPARVGDASYSLYLTHGFVQAAVGVAAAKLQVAGPAGLAMTFAAALLAPVPVSLAVHRWVERPLGRVAAAATRLVPGGHPGNARVRLS
jgi:exopolysaccharide production protein ExoZ